MGQGGDMGSLAVQLIVRLGLSLPMDGAGRRLTTDYHIRVFPRRELLVRRRSCTPPRVFRRFCFPSPLPGFTFFRAVNCG